MYIFALNSKETIMKNILKGAAFAAAIILSASAMQAQESFGNAGLEFALPVGDWAEDAYGFGIGGSGGYEFGLSDNLAITANVGITFFAIDDAVSDFVKSSYFIPIQVGGRYYLDESRSGLFGEVQVGAHIFGVSTEDLEILGQTIEGSSETETYLSLAPAVGFFLNENVSISLRYQLVFQGDQEVEIVNPITFETQTTTVDGLNLGYIGLKLAYNF